ncbi:hypothetical protein ACNKHK_27035 [Shigella flexneri]
MTAAGAWIEDNATFPCTMVDRIVPAATEETLRNRRSAGCLRSVWYSLRAFPSVGDRR